MNKLELLALGKDFDVVNNEEENYYEIKSKNSRVSAIVAEDEATEYYITGCYNSGCDWVEIDIEELEKLKKFCEIIKEN